MTRKSINTLIQDEIDGLLSQEEQEHLKKLLKTGTKAQKMQDDLAQTARLLKGMPQVKPPRTMKKFILTELRRRHSPAVAASSRPAWLNTLLNPRPGFAFTYGLMLGLLCMGMTVYLFRVDMPFNDQLLRGTLGQDGSLQRVSFTANEVRGTVGINCVNDRVGMQFVLQTDENIDLILEYDADAYKFQKFITGEFSPLHLERGERYIRALSKGNSDFLFEFRHGMPSDQPFRLKLSSDGIIRFQKDFFINE